MRRRAAGTDAARRSRARPGTASALVRAEARGVPWRLPAAAWGAGLVLAVAVALLPEVGAEQRLGLLRVVALCGAVGVAFALDDPARHTTRVAPVGRPLRQGLRLALLLPSAAVWWAVVVAVGRGVDPGPPALALTVEAAALAALAVALAAGGIRFSGTTGPGAAVAGALLALFTVAMVLPEGRTPFVPLGDARWTSVHLGWCVALAVGAVAWPLLAREPCGSRR
ncbi:ABC transporter [Streptomyces avicenniae]|uniref:ABC transporter n=1 Tax=Streptomyces avicenniae TaxID=500153 RepID=UPI000A67C51C|nr:ABC transporter [Streptomyces avicenniae]